MKKESHRKVNFITFFLSIVTVRQNNSNQINKKLECIFVFLMQKGSTVAANITNTSI